MTRLSILWALLIINPGISIAGFSGAVKATSNYVGRGYSKSNGELAYQANLDYGHKTGFYVGTAVSTVDFGDKGFGNPAHVEISPYLGWGYGLSEDWRLDLQWTRYWYDGNIYGLQADYNEFFLLLHYRDLLSANLSFSENYYNQGKPAGNYQLTGRYPVTDYLQISGSVGYSQTKSTLDYDYIYWNAGFTFFYKFAAMDFRYAEAATYGNQVATKWAFDPQLLKPSLLLTLSISF